LDAFTKYIWLFPLKQKSDVENIFLHFQTYVEHHFNTKIKVIQTDWEGEYHRLNTYFSKYGIQHLLACPYTHEQIGAVERRHRQIVEMGLALLAYANLPKPYWEDAFLTVVYIINRLPTKILNHFSLFEKAYHQKQNYNFMRVFGCACWPNLRPYNKHKFDYRSKTCIFIG
jgi:histone deacetylase 1/2